jgi:hypothetical protein
MNQDENLDEQALLQQLGAGGGQPQSGTQPVGAPAPFEAPAATGRDSRDALGGYAGHGALTGFNTSDYGGDVKGRTSMKNTFGRIASRYKNAPSSIDSIMADPDFQRHFAGAKKVQGGAGDKIDFGGQLSDFESGVPVGVVDVLKASDPNSDSADAWAWMDEANDGGGAQAGGMGGLDINSLLAASQGGGEAQGGSTLEQIQAELAALQNGQNTPMDLEALMAQLGGQ